MKILLVCKSLPPKVSGGIQTHTWKLSGHLVQLGHEVSILTAGSFFRLESSEMVEGRNVISIPSFPGRKMPLFADLLEEWSFNLAVQQWLWKHDGLFDIVHVQGRSGCLAPGSGLQMPVVTTFHGLMSIENARSGKSKKAGWSLRMHERWATRAERRSLQQSDACIAVSEEMLHELQMLDSQCDNTIRVLPNGVDVPKLESIKCETADASNTLLFVGRLDRIKGIYPLIEAMRKVKAPIRLDMIGDGPERAGLERAISAAGLSDRVRLLGALPQAEVFAHIRTSYALVLPSFHETQGIVLLEANACARPVIASDIPGIREVVQHSVNGLLTKVGNANSLSHQINWLFSHREEADQMGWAGREKVSTDFCWENIALETERLYGQLMANHGRKQAYYQDQDFKMTPHFLLVKS
ncbi:MAG: glycosyltransferase family 4 protein [Bacteroidota bacterium]